ncbi:MAG: class I SAM-dependent methyltransferase [Pirellulales bacterium]|nr:class I SAM-dependent methyltransferase [Pirellulales bacterium]
MAFGTDQYELLDFGDGRRLETFGPWRLDRPCPTAEGISRRHAELWSGASARFERTGENEGVWESNDDALPERWTVAHEPVRLELKLSPTGHLGLFPEQAENWDWIAEQVARSEEPVRVLNLFAYTGGSTLAAAAAGAEVTHVDAARNTVAWARSNAALSNLEDAPIRWITEDARKFVRRELKRGNRYDAVILDPPSYGHGPRGEVWRLAKHLPGLLAACAELTGGQCRFALLTCHTPGYDAARLGGMVEEAFSAPSKGTVASGPLTLTTATGLALPAGVAVRFKGK